jgi:hypothetical protein
MDRIIVYPGSIPLDTDLLGTNRNTMIALNALIQATLGNVPIVDGLAVTPTTPGSFNVQVAPGSITQLTSLDSAPYGTLGPDGQDACMKMGINIAPTFLTLPPPSQAGTSIAYLIEASFQESDVGAAVLAYYNAANPAQSLLGPVGTGVAQPTLRTQRVALQAVAGAPAATGTQVAPAAASGWIAIAAVTVNAGDTQIAAGAITMLAATPRALWKLPYIRPGFCAVQVFTASTIFTIPAGVNRAKITVIGAGGAGGSHQTLPSGGGGAGGRAISFIDYLAPGTQIPVTIGPGGAPLASGSYGAGGPGGTSSFGTIVSASGGQGGSGGTALADSAGGGGGFGVGGDINDAGAWGTDSIAVAGRGGDGGGPGGGRGSSGLAQGIAAPGYGGGGGGGGASAPSGGAGAQGGYGGPGLVIMEF